jgi:NADH-quinone oxidoreductase subunit G
LNHLSKSIKAKKYLRGYFGQDDGILLSADRTPNLRGALASGFANTYPNDNLSKLNSDLKKGVIDSVLVVNEDLLSSGVEAESLLGISIVYLGTHANDTTNLAEVIIPTLTSFEKKGTFINRSFFAQGFEQSIPGLPGLLPDVHILSKLLDALDDENKVTSDFSLIWKNLSSPPNSPFKGMSFSDSLRGSLKVDGTKWKDLPFVESKALHYKK